MNPAVRSFLAEPAVADPPARVWRDWALLAVIVAIAIPEAILRTDLVWPGLSLLSCLTVAATVLWRRTHPLAMLAVAFGASTALGIAGGIAGTEAAPGLYTMGLVLVLPYALARWASGRHIVVGAVMLSWLLGKPVEMDPHVVSKANTVMQIVLVVLVLGGLAFALVPVALVNVATALVGLMTAASLAVYLRDWLQHMTGPDGGQGPGSPQGSR